MSGVNFAKTAFPAGGGAFDLPRVALGVFLSDQPTHRLAVGADRRNHLPLMKNDGWILPAGSVGVCEYDEPLDAIIIDFDQRLLEEVGLAPHDEIVPHAGGLDPLLLQLAVNAETYLSEGRLYQQTLSRALAAHLVQLSRPARDLSVTVDDRRLRRVVEFIHDNLATDLSLDDLAGLAAMSPFHFSRAFKAATGRSPLQYVIERRIEYSKVLLKTTKLTVAEIAFRCGFESQGGFGRHFRKRVGTSPGSFRGD